MTRMPCLYDSPSVAWRIDGGGLAADLVLDPDADNGLSIDAAGLVAKYGSFPTACVYRGTAQAMATGDTVAFTGPLVRWDTSGGTMAIAGGLVLPVTGLWAVGYQLAVALGAVANGIFIAYCKATPSGAGTAFFFGQQSVCGSQTPQAGTAETFCASNFDYIFAGAGTTISLLADHTFGGTVNTVPSAGVTAVTAGAAEFAGTELYAHLVVPV